MIQFSKEAWFLWVGTLLLGTGINVSLNAGDLHEICLFVGSEMVGAGVLILIAVVWHMARRRSTDGNLSYC